MPSCLSHDMTSPLRTACIQLVTSKDRDKNLTSACGLIEKAAKEGAQFIATPEMTGVMDIKAEKSQRLAYSEQDDPQLKEFQRIAADKQIWLLIGSLAIRIEGEDRLANRSFLIGPDGKTAATYDKIHMFDVEVGDGQTYRESSAYRPGTDTTLSNVRDAKVGLSICYDLRFPQLYRSLAQQGADILTCPAAFTKVTGEAHWHTLIRARAIENGAFMVAPAQAGKHEDGRETFGHSLIVGPWGEVLAEGMPEGEDMVIADLDLSEVKKARSRIPALNNDRPLK